MGNKTQNYKKNVENQKFFVVLTPWFCFGMGGLYSSILYAYLATGLLDRIEPGVGYRRFRVYGNS